MKMDMSSDAITRRLKTVDRLRKLCLSLANSSAGKKVREEHPENEVVRRTARALGESGADSEVPGGETPKSSVA